jgi:hypothetical protein
VVAPTRRRRVKPFRPFTHTIQAITICANGDDVLVLAQDSKQYYRLSIPREALGRLANQDIVDLDE